MKLATLCAVLALAAPLAAKKKKCAGSTDGDVSTADSGAGSGDDGDNGNNAASNGGGDDGGDDNGDAAFAASFNANLTTALNGQIKIFEENKALIDGNTTDTFTNNNGGQGDDGVSQSSLTLDKSQVAIGSFQDGSTQFGADAGQVASLTSKNNFINFCATQQMPLTNGLQFRDEPSCNPIPMGAMPTADKIPTCTIFNPVTNANLKSQTKTNIQLRLTNMNLGNFVNAGSQYYSAPQQLDDEGKIIGHAHVVCNEIQSITDTTNVANATDFSFFKGINTGPSSAGLLTATVATGFPAGTYRCCSMNSAANHQPVLVSIAQRNNQDDCVRFTVSDDGDASQNVGDADSAKETADALAAAAAAFVPGATSPPPGSGGIAQQRKLVRRESPVAKRSVAKQRSARREARRSRHNAVQLRKEH